MADTWIFLRGLGREAGHWGTFPAVFQQRVDAARVVMLDLPGNGALWHQRSPAQIAGMLSACRAQLADMDIQPPYGVLAMSLGAMVATEWMRAAPAELLGAVLINTSLRPMSPFYRRLRPRNYARLLALACGSASAEDMERQILRLTSHAPQARLSVVAQWADLRARHPVALLNILRQLWAAARFRAPLQAAPVPLLLLSGAQDGLVHPACSEAIARAWPCAHVVHPLAGHDLPLDAPAWVADQVARWGGERDLRRYAADRGVPRP